MASFRNFCALLLSFQELKILYKHQFTEMDKMVWFENEATPELGLNSYLREFPNAQKEPVTVSRYG